jgi:pimeloyl-ACP methyl ester carboxylesterase
MNLNATIFDPANVRECAAASAEAYSSRPSVSCQQTDTQALVLEAADYIVVAFRGTSNLRDFVTDARFFRSLLLEEANGDRCEVHTGFLAAYESIIADLTAHLRQIVVADRKVFVTGHSLGGALAILAALELKRQGFNIAQVYTFGQPRVGNKAFAAMYNYALKDSTFALVNEGDPVPLLPPLLNGYRDCGTEIFLRKFGGTLVDPFIGFELFVDILGAWQSWRNMRLGLLPNHFLNAYRQRIQLLA